MKAIIHMLSILMYTLFVERIKSFKALLSSVEEWILWFIVETLSINSLLFFKRIITIIFSFLNLLLAVFMLICWSYWLYWDYGVKCPCFLEIHIKVLRVMGHHVSNLLTNDSRTFFFSMLSDPYVWDCSRNIKIYKVDKILRGKYYPWCNFQKLVIQ